MRLSNLIDEITRLNISFKRAIWETLDKKDGCRRQDVMAGYLLMRKLFGVSDHVGWNAN